jgi:hypothetical protein
MKLLDSSFRDPSGFLFSDEDGKLLRQVNRCYQSDYEMLIQSGLNDVLCRKGLLIRHAERNDCSGITEDAFRIIEPELVPFISYPYEWSFSQLKDAALATLDIQKIALEHDMWLKDASAYNIQFHNGRPVFIDTLSFEKYIDGRPWQAYGQFCRHFLAPLALMSYTDMRLNQFLRVHLDGIPLDLASRLLPFRARMSFSLLLHIHLHARSQQKYAQKPGAAKNVKLSKQRLEALILGLRIAVERLKSSSQQTEWRNYYDSTSYREVSFTHKKKILASFVEKINPEKIWDMGANTCEFTRIVAERGAECIAFDIDPHAVDAAYRYIKHTNQKNILPLIMDLTNPSPGIGWANNERMSLISRPLPDTLLALALIHHLAISNNLPLSKIARFFSSLAPYLIIEFVPKSDSQVQRLLTSRKDIFPDYTQEGFIQEFENFYKIREVERIADSERSMFLMQRR